MSQQHMIRGILGNGQTVWYTGRSGQDFVSQNSNEAFRSFSKEGASEKATSLNKMTAIHGIRFISMGAE